MDNDQGVSASPPGHSAEPEPQEGLGHSASVPNADSGNMPGYYGILNEARQFWTHTVHRSRKEAEAYIRSFWGQQTDMADDCLRKFQIIEVRVRLEPRKSQPPNRQGI